MKYLFALTCMFLSTQLHAMEMDVPHMATPSCETYIEWTGKNIDDVDMSILNNRTYRILKPDSMMTMDYSPDRLNINITNDGIILSQTCG